MHPENTVLGLFNTRHALHLIAGHLLVVSYAKVKVTEQGLRKSKHRLPLVTLNLQTGQLCARGLRQCFELVPG